MKNDVNSGYSIAMLDLLTGALGAVIILYIATPKYDASFKFAGSRIVFLFDISGSMKKAGKLDQATSALQMLVNSLDGKYQIDVVFFPYQNRLYRPVFGGLSKVTAQMRRQLYDELERLDPEGGTPVRDSIEYVLQKYPEATDIVLFSDGAPTVGNKNEYENIDALLSHIERINTKRVKISTIGIGEAFLQKSDRPSYQFLTRLAQQLDGFFVGF